jgi:hypothetical protein
MSARQSPGVVTFFNERLHIISLGKDNAVGFRLMVMTDCNHTTGKYVGQILGMTKYNRYFTRDIMLLLEERVPAVSAQTEEKFAAMVEETGIRKFHEWPQKHREAIQELRRIQEDQEFDDPILGIRPKSTGKKTSKPR